MTSFMNNVVCTPTVKNTFITFALESTADRSPRPSSVPPSLRLCKEGITDICDVEFSTRSPSAVSECDVKTPMSLDDYDYCVACDMAPVPQTTTKLNAKGSLFQPRPEPEPPVKEEPTQFHQDQIQDVIDRARKTMEASNQVENVQISGDMNGFSVIIKPSGDNEYQTESLSTLAKEALLDAASTSKCIYVMGYCAPNPFTMRPQGFEAKLAAMDNASRACWHVFKKGFCRHGAECRTEHPSIQVPIHVLVESASFNSCPRFASAFKDEMRDLAMSVTAKLGECPYTAKCTTSKDTEFQGWTITVLPKEELQSHKDYLISLAQSQLFSATNIANTLYITGYAKKPFTTTTTGFITTVGDMQDESKACWDLYSEGMCTRGGCKCRWEHPECYMPVRVVIEERTSLKALNDKLEILAKGQTRAGGD